MATSKKIQFESKKSKSMKGDILIEMFEYFGAKVIDATPHTVKLSKKKSKLK